MKLSRTLIIATVLVVASGTGAAYAYAKHGHWHMTPAEKVEFVTDRVSKHLELDAAQRQNFTALAELVADIAVDVRAGREAQMAELEQMLAAPVLDQARALELVQQKTREVNEKAPEVIASLAIFLDSLQPEQKQEMQAFIEHHREHHRHRFGNHDGSQ